MKEMVEVRNEVVEMEKEPKNGKRGLVFLLCLVIALTSFFVVGEYATNAKSYSRTIQSIDEKKATVMGVSTLATGVSLVLAAIPGDATTPVANEVVDVTSYLLIVVCALVLEKSLLTIFGGLAFKILIPVACAMFVVSLFKNSNLWKVLSIKVAIFAMAIAIVVPVSMRTSDLVYEANKSVVDELDAEVAKLDSEEETTENTEKKDRVKIEELIKTLINKIEESTKEVALKIKDKVTNLMNRIIDAVAIFVIAYCIIPVLIFVLMGWLLKLIFGIEISVPKDNPLKSVGRKAVDIVAKIGNGEK